MSGERPPHWGALELPAAVSRLDRDERGYPIPYFAAIVNGRHDFAMLDPAKVVECVTTRRCGICGGKLGALGWFISGAKTIDARLSLDPPMHLECGKFSLAACPHLALRNANYRTDEQVAARAGGTLVEVRPEMSKTKPERYALFASAKFWMNMEKHAIGLKRPEIIFWYAYDDAGRLVPISTKG